jgi:hypothetical protein
LDICSIDADVDSQRTPVAYELKPRLQERCAETSVLQPGQQINMHMRRVFPRDVRRSRLGVMN